MKFLTPCSRDTRQTPCCSSPGTKPVCLAYCFFISQYFMSSDTFCLWYVLSPIRLVADMFCHQYVLSPICFVADTFCRQYVLGRYILSWYVLSRFILSMSTEHSFSMVREPHVYIRDRTEATRERLVITLAATWKKGNCKCLRFLKNFKGLNKLK
jgi:hypothetical protein